MLSELQKAASDTDGLGNFCAPNLANIAAQK
jgi:hypothetical protein